MKTYRFAFILIIQSKRESDGTTPQQAYFDVDRLRF
jgi:hypothetical protein